METDIKMTNTNEISVARALSELKLLDARINRAITDSCFIGKKVGKKVQGGYETVEAVEKDIKAKYVSVKDLIERRNKVKSAIVTSNASTILEVAGKKMTVAEAIERKVSIIYDRRLLVSMKKDYALAQEFEQVTNERMNNRLDNHLETLFGKEGKTSAQANDDIVKSFKSDNEATLIDPLKLQGEIEALEEEILSFEAEVDLSLSESNALTYIAV